MAKSVVETSDLGNSPKRRFSRVDPSAPLSWIRRGIEDFRRAPALALGCGALFAALCFGASVRVQAVPETTFGYVTALAFAIPFLASALCTASHDLEQGALPRPSSLRMIWRRWSPLTLYSLMLAGLVAGWARLSTLLFTVYSHSLPAPEAALPDLISSFSGSLVLWLFFGLTVLLAWVIFAGSAIAIPLVLDGDADLVASMISSYRAVSLNPIPMLLWAGIVVSLAALGVATSFTGLTLVFPVLAFGTWHSYRDLVS